MKNMVVTGRQLAVAALLGIVAAIGIAESPESAAWAASGDVMFYLGTAETFAHGGGLRAPIGPWHGSVADSMSVTAHYPPGFALALAAPIRLGVGPERAARAVRAVCMGITVALAVVLTAAVAGLGAGALAGVLVMLSPFVVFTHTIVFSEPLFLPLFVATLALMVAAPDRPLSYGTAAALALGVRLIGVALTGAAVIWAARLPGTIAVRARRAALALAPSVLVEGVWLAYVRMHHAADDRHFGWYGPAWPLVRKLIGVNLWWFWPVDARGAWEAVAKGIMLVTFALICLGAWRVRDATRTRRLLAAVALVVVAHDGVYFVARLVLDWANFFEMRNFAAVHVSFAIALAAALATWWPRLRSGVRRWMAGAVLVWIAAAAYGSWTVVRDAAAQSREWATTARQSPLLGWVREDRGAHEIYTNFNTLVWRATGHRTRNVPLLDDPDSIAAFGASMARTGGVLVGWSGRLPLYSLRADQMAHYASPEKIAAALRLPVLLRSDEGAVWGAPTR